MFHLFMGAWGCAGAKGEEDVRLENHLSGKEKYMKNKVMIRMLTALMAAAMLFALSAIPVRASGLTAGERPPGLSPAAGNGIVSESGKTYFYVNGSRQTGLIRAGDKVYYADGRGVLQTGFRTVGGIRYYFNANSQKFEGHEGLLNVNGRFYICMGGVIQYGRIFYGGGEYLAGPDGLLKSGWQNVNGRVCYYWPEAGGGHGRFQKAAGTVVIGGVTHYLDGDGIPLKTFRGMALDEWGAAAESADPAPASPPSAPAPSAPAAAPSAADARFFGDVSAGRTLTQKAILSCLNYYEDRLQKLNRDNRFGELSGKTGQSPRNVWQYSNRSPLSSYFAAFDRMNGGAFSYKGKTVRYCNCDSCKWWVVKDLMHTNSTRSKDLNTLWKKYTVKGLKFRDIYEKGYFTVRQGGKDVRIDLVPGTCFYDILPNGKSGHTWIYMGPDRSGTDRIFDTGHGGVHSDPGKTDHVRSWERDLSGRFHTDGNRAIFRTWVNEVTDTRDFEDKTVGTIWVPCELKTFYYRNGAGKLVKY